MAQSLSKDFIVKNGLLVATTATIQSKTNATSTITGALIVSGGAGIGGDVWGRNFYSNGYLLNTSSFNGGTISAALTINNQTQSSSTETGALIVKGGVGIGGDLWIGGTLHVNAQETITTGTVVSYFQASLEAGPGIKITTSTTYTRIENTGVITISQGTDTVVTITTGGYVTIWNTSTLQSVTNRGATTTNSISFNNTTNSTSTTTGAVTVTGGIGIGRDLYVGGGLVASGINLLNKNQHIWYVDSVIGVNDYTKNSHPMSPARTIKYALSYADSGDTVFIQPGTYYEEFPLTVATGVSVRGAGLREVVVYPTTATNTATAFLLTGETLISDFTITGFFEPGYAFEFAPNAYTFNKSPYIERLSVITKGSTISAGDPNGFDANDAGGGAKIDGSRVLTTSSQASMMFNEVTFIVPNATGL
jgi:hypothetical protein